MKKILLSK